MLSSLTALLVVVCHVAGLCTYALNGHMGKGICLLRTPLAWCIAVGEGVIWGLGANTWWVVSTIWSSASTWLVSRAK